MSIYERKQKWKIGLLLFALVIVAISLLYTNNLAHELSHQERNHMQLVANATFELTNNPMVFYMDTRELDKDSLAKVTTNISDNYTNFLTNIIKENHTIPLIITNEKDNISSNRNLENEQKATEDPEYVKCVLEDMKENGYPPIIIDYSQHYTSKPNEKKVLYVYYDDSRLLKQLKMFPFIQLGIIAIFLLVAYVAFDTTRRSEQNKVWLGMAKETAHQLGTPLSSLVAWIELLKEDEDSEQAQMVGHEIEKDIGRLRLIADRFSKIGSTPTLVDTNIVDSIDKTVRYIRRRASGRVKVFFDDHEKVVHTKLNSILFDWVIENLLKNALDAMGGKGEIHVRLTESSSKILIEVSDTGKGIPKSKFKTIFEPGFSTKKRGWGLGLSLSKRIVEHYHSGKIFVSNSALNKGTTFKIILPKT